MVELSVPKMGDLDSGEGIVRDDVWRLMKLL